MALVPIISQTWDTTSVFNPTRMNNIEQNLAIVSDATGVKYSNGVSVKDKIDSVNTNLGSQLFFGANDGQHYSSNKTSVDAIIDDVVQVASGDTHGYFSVQNIGNITGYGNRQFLFGWINSQKNYGWVMIATYNNKISFGYRSNSSTFSIREL